MKVIFIIFLILSMPFISKAQLHNPFLGTVTIESCTNISSNQYVISILDFNDLRNLKFGYQIEEDYYIWSRSTIPNKNCQVFRIDSVVSKPLGKYDLYVTNLYESGFMGNAQVGDNLPIVQNTPTINISAFLPSTGGDFGTVDAIVQTCMLNDALIKIDSIKYKTLAMVDPVVSLDVLQDSIIILTKQSGITFGDTISLSGTVNYTLIETDNLTILGDGSPSNQVRVDTTYIATQNYVDSQTKSFFKQTLIVGVDLTVGDNQILLTFNPTGTLIIYRNGVHLNYSLNSQTVTFNNYNFINNEEITIYHYN